MPLDAKKAAAHGSSCKGMDFSRHVFDALPPDWTSFLEPSSFLRLQCTNVFSGLCDVATIESYWCNLCRSQLQHFIGQSAIEINLDTESFRHSFIRRGSCQVIAGGAQLTRAERQKLWLRAYTDLVNDIWQACPLLPCSYSTPSGSLWMTAGNELRHQREDFRFPALLDAHSNSRNEELVDHFLEEVQIDKDSFNRFTSCSLKAPLGGDRCVMAKMPLPRLGVATAISSNLAKGRWQIAWRSCSYYEVEIKPGKRPRREVSRDRTECISVGLALATIPLRGLCVQQAGWNHSSWALHGDDGQLYHGHGRGRTFRPLKNFVLVSEEDTSNAVIDLTKDEDGTSKHAGCRKVPTFGQGDVVGCGVAKFQNSFGIFFTLNGTFLGVCFLLRAFAEPRFWPCVGIDAAWDLSFNFGARPFRFNPSIDIKELPSFNHPDDDLSALLEEYPPARWPGEAFTRETETESYSESEYSVASRTVSVARTLSVEMLQPVDNWSDNPTDTESSD